MPIFHNHVGINLTETKFQFVEISYKQNSFYLENVDQSILKEFFSPSLPEIKLINILQESFEKISKKKAVTSKFVSFSLPNNFFKIVEIPYDDTLTKKDLSEHFKWELSVLFPDEVRDKFFLQNIDINKTLVRQEYKTIIFALDKKIVNAVNKFCKANGLELKFVDNAHLSSNAFLHLDKNITKESVSLSLYIDQKYSSVAALEGFNPFYFKVLNTNTGDFIPELGKILFDLNKYKINKESIQRVILNGQNVTSDFEKNITGLIGIQLIKINPFERLKTEENIKTNHLYLSQFNSFTAATGVAIRIV